MLEEYIKIDEFINLLENGGVEKIIEHLKYKDNLGNETAYVILKPIKKEEWSSFFWLSIVELND